jgi:hypothetical protein
MQIDIGYLQSCLYLGRIKYREKSQVVKLLMQKPVTLLNQGLKSGNIRLGNPSMSPDCQITFIILGYSHCYLIIGLLY